MKIRTQLRSFTRREDGTILVFWAMALAMVLGLVALSFDIGRLATTQSELQSFADHVALAAAGELDGNSDSITRATAAAANLISDTQSFGKGGRALGGSSDFTLDFFATLPPQDTTAMPYPNPSPPQPEDAVYARVIVNPKSVDFGFGSVLSIFLGGNYLSPSTNAVAIAGFTQYACDVAPMMFCIPSPSFDADNAIGHMVRLRSGAPGSAWGPGNFGFLEPQALVDLNGNCANINANSTSALLTCALGAAGSITQCYPQRGVTTETGQMVGITNVALNMRFDIWPQSTHNKEMIDPAYAPAPNVIKGVQASGGGCNWNNSSPTTDTLALPRDTCFPGCAPYGDGNFDIGPYIATNYSNGTPPAGVQSATTRYGVYLAEVGALGTLQNPNLTPILPQPKSETGRVMCSPNQFPDPDRRVLIAAGVNCDPAQGGVAVNGHRSNVPVKQFVKMFITEPVNDPGSNSSLDMYVEILGSAQTSGNGSTGVIHDVVQLYR